MGFPRTVHVGEIHNTNNYGKIQIVSYTSSKSVKVRFLDTSFETSTSSRHILSGNVRDSGASMVGARHQTNDGLAIIEQRHGGGFVTVRFAETGSLKRVSLANLKSGSVSDNFKKTVCGVGYIGDGECKSSASGRRTPAYQCWRDMLRRCYDKRIRAIAPTYIDCTVDVDWHNFQNFATWYEEHYPKDGGKYDIDKDIKVPGNRVYSAATCMFVTRKENNTEMAHRVFALDYRFTDPNGKVIELRNLKQFCRENNLDQAAMRRVSLGVNSTYKGWKAA